MTLYSDYTQIGNDKYYNRDLEARQALNNLGALAAKNQAALATDVSGVLPIANGGTGANNAGAARAALQIVKTGGQTTFYVSTSGNDTTGDGTQNKPYRTIMKAVNECPKIQVCSIYVAPGTYNENVTIYSKMIQFFSASDGEIVIDGGNGAALYCECNSIVFIHFRKAKFKSNSPSITVNASYSSMIRFHNDHDDTPSGYIEIINTNNSDGHTLYAGYGSFIGDSSGAIYPVILTSNAHGILTNGPVGIYLNKVYGHVSKTLVNAVGGSVYVSNYFRTSSTFTTERSIVNGSQYLYS